MDTAQIWRLLKHLEKSHSEDRVFLVGDRRQHQAVGPGRIFEELQMGGMETRRTDKIIRQKTEELRQIVTEFSRGRTDEALSLMDQRGAITQIENRDRRYSRIARDYVAIEGTKLVVSPDNESRHISASSLNYSPRADSF